jgi:hypothetical protein
MSAAKESPMRTLGKVLLVCVGFGASAACSAVTTPHDFGNGGTGNGATSEGTGNGSGTGNSGQGGSVTFNPASGSTSTGTGASSCVVTDPTKDMDGDGWSPAQGDCNDCDPNVNPGAIDVVPVAGADGGVPPQVDSDCSGAFNPPVPCDTGLALADANANDAAKAIELCQTTASVPASPKLKTWGVINSSYVRADGTPFANPGLQVGIQNGWGPNVHPQAGANMVAISSGNARTASQPGACGMDSCFGSGPGNPPPGFPQDNPSCPPSLDINDDVGLELLIRSPTNATGYSFSFKFYSMEYPYWVCDNYNDQFIALVSPAPMGSINGNISFDAMHNPVSVNLGFFDVCDPSQIDNYASDCQAQGGNCPNPPSPYCPSGTAQLKGTGFDVWDSVTNGTAGATSWLKSQAPVKGGSLVTIRFAMWDTGDDAFDSTTLIDDFQWIATPGTDVTVGTAPINQPK